MPRPDPWILALAASLSAMLGVFVVFQMASAIREWRTRRAVLSGLQTESQAAPEGHPQVSVVRNDDDLEPGVLLSLAERLPWLWDVHHVLSQSGLRWTLEGLFARSAVSGLVTGLVPGLLFGRPAVGIAGFLIGVPGPFLYVRWKKVKRIRAVERQLPDAIDLIARAVRAGHPLSEGLRMVAQEGPQPLGAEFRVTFEEQRFGLPFEEALLGLGDRVEVVDMRILITAILVQREVGGNLSEILERIAETMRARFNLKRQVRVYTAQGRMSGYTLAALPILVGLVITVINPDYMQTLYREPLGQALLASAAVLQVIGFLWIRRIVDVRY